MPLLNAHLYLTTIILHLLSMKVNSYAYTSRWHAHCIFHAYVSHDKYNLIYAHYTHLLQLLIHESLNQLVKLIKSTISSYHIFNYNRFWQATLSMWLFQSSYGIVLYYSIRTLTRQGEWLEKGIPILIVSFHLCSHYLIFLHNQS